eukprot:CAMPEP_0194354274 /NCGR_PEP_ID=MMETSP0174-20130528/2466_1 /TAXON_ID=216777 /ORGANISM="Proboscia alata, Strain PI-D3" /LENGTH=582 /DNA_ID=CAMNT_0039123171 /DNA_START=88 /DNA_END=1836 /DNA_ORIENTATION=+
MSSKVKAELEALRNKKLARFQHNKLESNISPEEEMATAFTTYSKKFKPKGKLGGGGVLPGSPEWFMQQRNTKTRERQKRREAEAMLRGYRLKANDNIGKGTAIPSPTAYDYDQQSIDGRSYFSNHTNESKSITGKANTIHGSTNFQNNYSFVPRSRTQNKEYTIPGRVNFEDGSVCSELTGGRGGVSLSGNSLSNVIAKFEYQKKNENVTVWDGRRWKRTTKTFDEGKEGEGGDEANRAEAELDVVSEKFKRRESQWRNFISTGENAQFPPEKNRYHLFVAYSSPWAHRTLIVLALKGLQDAISVTMVHPIWQKTRKDDAEDDHVGWIFGNENGEPLTSVNGFGGPFPPNFPGNEPDPVNDSFCIRDIYNLVDDTDGPFTVPLLWDLKGKTIVSNESSDIMRMMNSEFNDFATNADLDLYPESDRETIDQTNNWLYHTINDGVYRCGYAKCQDSYDLAIDSLTASFDLIETILQSQKYIAGNRLTEADIRLFATLFRFDEVYAIFFKTNTRSVENSPTILNYCREIYQMSSVADTCNMSQVKTHYYCSNPDLNEYSIIPLGMDFETTLKEPHNRGDLSNPEP